MLVALQLFFNRTTILDLFRHIPICALTMKQTWGEKSHEPHGAVHSHTTHFKSKRSPYFAVYTENTKRASKLQSMNWVTPMQQNGFLKRNIEPPPAFRATGVPFQTSWLPLKRWPCLLGNHRANGDPLDSPNPSESTSPLPELARLHQPECNAREAARHEKKEGRVPNPVLPVTSIVGNQGKPGCKNW